MSEKKYAGISSASVQKATGKTWEEWLTVLDAAGAKKMAHPQIVAILGKGHSISHWWRQMLTVGYEQARGLRAKHQRPDGYNISRSKTIAASGAAAFAAWKDKRKRAKWLADPGVTIRTAIENKSLRVTWIDGETNVEVMLYEKGPEKTQITVQHSRIANAKEAERMKQYWSEQLAKLQALLEEKRMRTSIKYHDASGILSELQSDSPGSRDQGASEAADWFESGQILENQYTALVLALLDKATSETDRAAKESIFNALSSASMSAMNRLVDWTPVANTIGDLDLNCLEHALVILGFSKQPKFRKVIEAYFNHPDRDISQAAAEALEENAASLARRSV